MAREDGVGGELDHASVAEQVNAAIAASAAGSRRLTMIFDPTRAADAAKAVRRGGSLASFVEELQQEGSEATVDPSDALAADGFEYRADASAREAEDEISAWHDLLHRPPS